MRKILISFIIMLMGCSSALAAGGTTHIYIAEKTRANLPEGPLKTILTIYQDDYYTGADYPDSGYVKGASYGEISHWDPFLDAYIEYLHKASSHPKQDKQRLIAFLMGVATHRVADELWHWTFINHLAEQDFNGNWDDAHTAADRGIDIIIAVDLGMKDLSLVWRAPVSELTEVYKLMGHRVTAQEINTASKIFDLALRAERAASPLMYPFYKYQMPWGIQHYQDDHIGGITHMARASAEKLEALWQRI